MMKKLLFITVVCVFMAAPAIADIFPFMPLDPYDSSPDTIPTANDKNDGGPDIFDAVNQLLGSGLTDNEQVDPRFIQPDYVWQELNGQIALIGLSAGNSNTVGYYTDLGSGAVQTDLLGPYTGFGFLGDGTATNPYPAQTFSIASDPALYGWYLKSNADTWYSEATLNANEWDHLMTFDIPELAGMTVSVKIGNTITTWTFEHPYLLAWEDLNLGDVDYDDMIYLVDKVAPVPVPGAVLLGILGLGAVGIKLRKYA